MATGTAAQAPGGGVPAVPLILAVGVTGHRDLGPTDLAALYLRLHTVLDALRQATLRLHTVEADIFAAAPPVVRLLSPLAAGADQVAARAALDLGYDLHAVLPFRRADYRTDFAAEADRDAAAAFDELIARADRVLELPCHRGDVPSAYALAGRATVAHCDVLIAVWDGLPARGVGGTAEVVEDALRRGLPVIHVAVDAARPTLLVWSAHEPDLLQTRIDQTASRLLDAFGVDLLVTQLLAPPRDPVEREHLAMFVGERERRFTPRIEFPLLLALTGVRRPRLAALVARPYMHDVVAGDTAALATWRAAYAWSDGLAAHFAQCYRSGHVFNFVAGAAAVLLGLSGLLMPGVKLWLALTELAVIGAFILNTQVAVARNWHRRWLDYRQLAERLRPMGRLVEIGIAQPDRQSVTRRALSWVDWYAAGIWRSIGLPSGDAAGGALSGDVAALTEAIVGGELGPQVDYHRRAAAAVHRLDHRLHRAGTVLFVASCLSCVAFIVAFFVDHEWTVANALAFVALSAGLPAIGTAFFGIRVQGDFAGTAARSEVTADHLMAIAAALSTEPATLARTADGGEAAARAMIADLGEWRLSHQQRQLELG